MVGGGSRSFLCQTQLRFCFVELKLSWGIDNKTVYYGVILVLWFRLKMNNW